MLVSWQTPTGMAFSLTVNHLDISRGQVLHSSMASYSDSSASNSLHRSPGNSWQFSNRAVGNHHVVKDLFYASLFAIVMTTSLCACCCSVVGAELILHEDYRPSLHTRKTDLLDGKQLHFINLDDLTHDLLKNDRNDAIISSSSAGFGVNDNLAYANVAADSAGRGGFLQPVHQNRLVKRNGRVNSWLSRQPIRSLRGNKRVQMHSGLFDKQELSKLLKDLTDHYLLYGRARFGKRNWNVNENRKTSTVTND